MLWAATGVIGSVFSVPCGRTLEPSCGTSDAATVPRRRRRVSNSRRSVTEDYRRPCTRQYRTPSMADLDLINLISLYSFRRTDDMASVATTLVIPRTYTR